MYAWMENVQAYEQDGFDYQEELVRYVNADLANEDFFQKATSVHVLGCHDETTCAGRLVADFPDRLRAFEKVLAAMGLQFGSHAEPAPPFKAFPGQKEPAPAGVSVELGVLADEDSLETISERIPTGTLHRQSGLFGQARFDLTCLDILAQVLRVRNVEGGKPTRELKSRC